MNRSYKGHKNCVVFLAGLTETFYIKVWGARNGNLRHNARGSHVRPADFALLWV